MPEALARRIESACWRHRLVVVANRNRRVLVSLRRRTPRGWTLGLREELLAYDDLEPELVRFVREGGRGRFPVLQARMQAVFDLIHQAEQARPPCPDPEVDALIGHGGSIDLMDRQRALLAVHFPHLAPIPISWSRNPGTRSLKSIRFGVFRGHPSPRIAIHPRLRLPWVPNLFVDHVIHHECCHYAQHADPRRGERPHSPRFKAWERQFPHFELARRWERRHLSHLLAGSNDSSSASIPESPV